MKTPFGVTAVLALLLAACAATPAVPMRSEFGDFALPEGLTYRPGDSTIIESPTVRAARLLYRGRIEPGSLALAMQNSLGGSGWRLVRNTVTGGPGTAQVYEKGGASLEVRIWEGGLFGWYTYVELTGTRAAGPTTTTATR